MSSALPSRVDASLDRQEADRVLERFEQCWHKGPPPRIEDFLPAATAANRAAWYELLAALIKIDLDRRCRQRTADPARLESYLQRWPELARMPEMVLNLVRGEYEARCLWAQRPEHAEYLARFPQYQAKIGPLLAEADRDLVGELAEAAQPGPPAADPPGPAVPATQATPITSCATFLEILGQCQFLAAAQWHELTQADWPQQFGEPRALAAELLKRGWLTPFQVNQLFQGRGPELVVGPYLLLERLGAGGTGLVFKALHRKMQRAVALKLIRRELVRDAEVVSRFLRELQVISQLDHPHIVHAYDAGPIGETYFLAMEYVEGVDLDRLVRRSGPLSATEACAYVRQAALGLQHAHERGLVHRDIKPSNLFLARSKGPGATGVVKLLDLGLARFREVEGKQQPAAEAVATRILTPVGSVLMGTPDYMAPEQANDFHAADIRADVYSLGCTLYFLLTGRAPFAGATLAQKLVHHQMIEPPDVRTLRPEIPAALARALRKMMAKRPEDRYQTPGELAAALPEQPERVTLRQKLWKLVTANRAASAVALLSLVLLATALGFVIRNRLAYGRERKEKEELAQRAIPAFVEAARRAVERRQLDAALEQANLALRYDPENTDARLLKGEILIVQKDFAGARAELERYLRLRPADKDAARLLELCQRPRPEDAAYLLDIAQMLERKDVPSLADVLLTRHGTHSLDARTKLLELYRKRIDAAWPGLGGRLTMDPTGIYSLTLENTPQVKTLEPLEGMPLTAFTLYGAGFVADLAPLKGMPLRELYVGSCPLIQDLTPLKGLPLNSFTAYACPVTDLAPLRGMKLKVLKVHYCGALHDLSPLEGMPLTVLDITQCTRVHDLTPLQGLSLTELHFTPQLISKGLAPLRAMKSLRTIGVAGNALPAPEFWKKCDAGEFAK